MTPASTLPKHVAIIMDGNGRWAKKRGLSRQEGHKAGEKTVREVVTHCRKLGIPLLTLYAFSKENWKRPKEEISALFNLLIKFLNSELSSLLENSIRLRVIGSMDELPLTVRKPLLFAIKKTAPCKEMIVNLALNYSGRDDIVRACRKCIEDGIKPQELTEELLSNYLYTAGQPDPDLIIRTSGEMRISNFLIFQAAYAEFYFTDTLWPDFTIADLNKALEEYAKRNRKFGA